MGITGPIEAEAYIFDVDGTLVDTNGMHIESWLYAFEKAGMPRDELSDAGPLGIYGSLAELEGALLE